MACNTMVAKTIVVAYCYNLNWVVEPLLRKSTSNKHAKLQKVNQAQET